MTSDKSQTLQLPFDDLEVQMHGYIFIQQIDDGELEKIQAENKASETRRLTELSTRGKLKEITEIF